MQFFHAGNEHVAQGQGFGPDPLNVLFVHLRLSLVPDHAKGAPPAGSRNACAGGEVAVL